MSECTTIIWSVIAPLCIPTSYLFFILPLYSRFNPDPQFWILKEWILILSCCCHIGEHFDRESTKVFMTCSVYPLSWGSSWDLFHIPSQVATMPFLPGQSSFPPITFITITLLDPGGTHIPLRGQMTNSLGLMSHMFVSKLQKSAKVAGKSWWMTELKHDCSNKTLFTKPGSESNLAAPYSFSKTCALNGLHAWKRGQFCWLRERKPCSEFKRTGLASYTEAWQGWSCDISPGHKAGNEVGSKFQAGAKVRLKGQHVIQMDYISEP